MEAVCIKGAGGAFSFFKHYKKIATGWSSFIILTSMSSLGLEKNKKIGLYVVSLFTHKSVLTHSVTLCQTHTHTNANETRLKYRNVIDTNSVFVT